MSGEPAVPQARLEKWLGHLRRDLQRPLTISEQRLLEAAAAGGLVLVCGADVPAESLISTFQVRSEIERQRRAQGLALWDGLAELVEALRRVPAVPVRVCHAETPQRMYMLYATLDGDLIAVTSTVGPPKAAPSPITAE